METKTKIKLLIVDDETYVCEIMKEHFQRRGYSVSVANSAQEALPIIKENNLQIMLLDKRLPGLTGIELLRNIRQFNQDIKVIMVSGDGLDTETKEEMKKLNILEYLEKPVVLSVLDAALEKAASVNS